MSWILAGLLALTAFLVMAFLLKAPRVGWEAIAAALVVGIAGYALQANPGLAGAPREGPQAPSGDPAALVKARQSLDGKAGLPAGQWLVVGDALARNGQYADAAGVLLGAVRHDSKNADAWLALANALVSHADGTISPASLFAFQKAMNAAPEHPGPPFFLGLALAQSGRFAEARGLWGGLLARSAADAPWRADLEDKLRRLDALIAQQQGMGTSR